MTQNAKPKQILAFQRKDLLAACWGNAREADLLYHFLNSASWAVTNGVVEESCKNITLQESHETLLGCVPMAEGTLIKDLKRFNLAGYVTSGRYGTTYTVNKEAIQKAFTNPPEKPLSAPRGRPKGFKVSRINKTKKSETLEENTETSRINEEKSEVSRIIEHEEVSRLNEKVLSLELEVLSLKEKVLNLELLVLNLKLSETRESAPEDAGEAKVSLQNDLEMIQNDSEKESTYSDISETATVGASAPAHAPLSQDEIAEQIRSRIPEGDAILMERLSNGNHRIYRKSGRSIGELIPVGVDVSDGLLELITVDSTTEIPYLPDFMADQSKIHIAQDQDQPASEENSTEREPAAADGYQKPDEAEQDVLIERPAIPEMPPVSARWCAETLVQIVEAKNKKYYREAARTKEINAAKRIIKGDSELTRPRFEMAYDERNDEWWHDHKGPLHVHHMAEKDRVHEMLDRIDDQATRKGSKPSSQSSQSKGYTLAVNDPTYNIDDDFYNNAAAWAAFDAPKGGTVHV